MNNKLALGITGGIGPLATAEFINLVMSTVQNNSHNQHFRILMDCNPHFSNIAHAISDNKKGDISTKELANSLVTMKKNGADFGVIICNAAHAFYDQIQHLSGLPLISIIDETCNIIPSTNKSGILAATCCLDADLYQQKLIAKDIEPVILNTSDQLSFEVILTEVQQGNLSNQVILEMLRFVDILVDQGAKNIILGCTELPLVLNKENCSVPLLDPMVILAQKVVAIANRHTELV